MRLITILALFAIAAPSEAAPRDLSKLLEPIRKQHEVPALGGAIVKGGKLEAIGAVGVRKLGSDKAVTVDDLWHLGSCTKAMTATLLARAVERGDFAWETTLPKALPAFKGMDPGYRDVTLDDLVRNRGGAPADLSADGLWMRLWQRKGTPTQQRRALANGVLTKAPLFPRGEKYLYSNAGFAIAGYALEVKAKKPWETLMRKELFEPLGMKSAGFGAPGKGMDQPWGHAAQGARVVPVAPGPQADNPPAIGPAGTVHATLADWSKFVALHLQAAQDGKEDLLLKRATLRRLHTPRKGETYAAGWVVAERPWGGGRVLNHNGSNTMWYCVTWLAPKKGFAVLLTCNQGGPKAAKACDVAAGALIRDVLAQERK
ncbi:MAG: serine hydrolase domain-containing protein [Planctomycetota bacterium]